MSFLKKLLGLDKKCECSKDDNCCKEEAPVTPREPVQPAQQVPAQEGNPQM